MRDELMQLQARALDRAECEQILATNHVGRVAYADRTGIEVKPVHYVYSKGWIYGRGDFAQAYGIGQWHQVTFEVEEFQDPLNWRYVVVQGAFYVLDPRRSPEEAETWQHAAELLRPLGPEAFQPHDAVPDHLVICRIAAQELSGEAATCPRPVMGSAAAVKRE